MAIHTVLTSGELQPALNRALPGDEIVLKAGVRYVGTFNLPPKDGPVKLRCITMIVRRAVVADSALLATIAGGSSGRALDGTGTANWIIEGVAFEPNVGGFGEVIGLENAENVTMDAILLIVPEGKEQKRGVLGNGRNITLKRSHLSGIWRTGQDSQAFAAWDGPGPYTLEDNYLEAASENVMFGGADASSAAHIPADIRIVGNTLTKPLAWKGTPHQVKNLLELKAGKRVYIADNDLSNNWADAQSGFAVLFTPRNQDGTAPFTVIEDVTFERNTLRNSPMGLNIAGYDDLNVSGQTTRIVVRDNRFDVPGTGALLHHGLGKVSLYRNDFGPATERALLSLDRGAKYYAVDDLIWAENTGGGYLHSPTHSGEAALKAYTRTYSLGLPADTPSVPDVVDGPTDPLPGTVIEPPSVPERDLATELELLRDTVLAISAHVFTLEGIATATEAEHVKLVAYLQKAPKVSRIEQLRAYIAGVGK